MIHTEVFKTGIDHIFNMLLSGNAVFDLVGRSRQELCRDYHIIALCKIPQSASDILLACTALVSDSSIIKVYAQIQAAFDDLSCLFFADRPAVLTFCGITKAHTSHTDTGYIQIRITKLYIFHIFTPNHFCLITALPRNYTQYRKSNNRNTLPLPVPSLSSAYPLRPCRDRYHRQTGKMSTKISLFLPRSFRDRTF